MIRIMLFIKSYKDNSFLVHDGPYGTLKNNKSIENSKDINKYNYYKSLERIGELME